MMIWMARLSVAAGIVGCSAIPPAPGPGAIAFDSMVRRTQAFPAEMVGQPTSAVNRLSVTLRSKGGRSIIRTSVLTAEQEARVRRLIGGLNQMDKVSKDAFNAWIQQAIGSLSVAQWTQLRSQSADDAQTLISFLEDAATQVEILPPDQRASLVAMAKESSEGLIGLRVHITA